MLCDIISKMNRVKSYSWRNIKIDLGEEIKRLLLKMGWKEEDTKSSKELWRTKLGGFNCILYTTGTLFFSYPSDKEDKFEILREDINRIVGSRYILPTRDILIGIDEVGKGEVIGSIVLVGVVFPSYIFHRLDLAIDNIDTKYSHRMEYWEDIYRKIERFKDEGLSFVVDKILPSEINKKINSIMDDRYRRIVERLTSNIGNSYRLVIDDYRVGKGLEQFLRNLEDGGAEIIITSKSEDKYLETKVASIIAKWVRTRELIDIGIPGTGNTGDRKTLDWLEEWYRNHRDWPWFVKRSFRTIREIEDSISINIKGR